MVRGHSLDWPGLAGLRGKTRGEPDVRVAILDGPVDLQHPSFRGARLRVVDPFGAARTTGAAAAGHGTFVTSLIFGGGEGPVSGIAPGCGGILIPIFKETADGGIARCSQLDLARAITRAVEEGARIISISAGQFSHGDEAEHYLARAVALCAESNVLIVAAAGNDGCDCVHVPAAVPTVLAIGACDSSGQPLKTSNWGAAYRRQGLLAPGDRLPGAAPGGGTTRKSGTSVATAVVAGVAALLASVQRLAGGTPDMGAIRSALLAGATPCRLNDAAACRPLLAGRLNIDGALSRLKPAMARGVTAASEPLTVHSDDHREGFVNMNSDFSETDELDMTPALEFAGVEASADTSDTGDTDPAADADADAEGVAPSECAKCKAAGAPVCAKCKAAKEAAGKAASASLVYALGTIGYDFISEARRDSFVQAGLSRPSDPEAVLIHLKSNPEAATSLRWTLNQDGTTIYAIVPYGPYAHIGYDRLQEFLAGQLNGGIEQVSVPGRILGSVKLQNGQVVPVIQPELRGMFSWSTPKLVTAVAGPAPTTDGEGTAAYVEKARDIVNFLERVYYETRNLGVTPQERALNFAATNAFQVERIFESAIRDGMKLDGIAVERSPIARPNSSCWDVKLRFFNPSRRLEQARKAYRFTIDVNDIIPVTIGKVRSWDVY